MNGQLENILLLALILMLLPELLCQPNENHHELIANSWVLPDSCATVGRVFQYQIPRLESVTNTIEYYVVTEAGSDRLPIWLHFESSTSILQGVPLVQDEGFMYICITAHIQSSKELPHESIKDIFSIDVRLPSAQHNHWSSLLTYEQAVPESRMKTGTPDAEFSQRTKCRPDQATYTASLILDIRLEIFRGDERVTLVQNFADFVSKNDKDVRLSARRSSTVSRLLDSDVLAAGPGNINITEMYPSKISHGVELTWPLACGGFPKLNDFVQVISHNIAVGTVSNVTGFKVIGWYVTREQPLIRPRKISVDRRKRQVPGNLVTPIPTPIITSAPPTAYVSTTVVEATSSQQIPTRTSTSMVSLTAHSSSLPVSPSSSAPVMATSTEVPFPTTSIPIFTPQTSSIMTETMQFSPTLPGSDFPPISTSPAFPSSSSLHIPSTGVPILTSTELPVTSFTLPSLETQAPSLQSTPQRLVSTFLPISVSDITRTTSFRSSEMPYFSTTLEVPFPTTPPMFSSTTTVLSVLPSAAITTFIPSATVSLQVQSTQTTLLPSSIIFPTMPLLSSTQYSTPEASFTLPPVSFLSSAVRSAPSPPVAETSSVAFVSPSSSGITSVSEISIPLPTSTTLTSAQSSYRSSTISAVIIEPSPSGILPTISTISIIQSSSLSSTIELSPHLTRTESMASSIPIFTERMTTLTKSTELSPTMVIPQTTLTAITSDQSTSLLLVPSFTIPSILPTDILTPVFTSSIFSAPMLSSSEPDRSEMLSVPHTSSQVSLSILPTVSASARTSAIFPLTSVLQESSQALTTAFVSASSAFLSASPSLSPETSVFLGTPTVLSESSVLQLSTTVAESSMLLPRTSALEPGSTVLLSSAEASMPMSTAQGTITATQLASSSLVEPSISSMFASPSASLVPTSFQPSMLTSLLPPLLSSITTSSTQKSSSFLSRLTETVPSSLPLMSTYYSESLLTPSTPVLETSVVMGSASLISTSLHEFSSPVASMSSFATPTFTIVPSTPEPTLLSSSAPVSSSQTLIPEMTVTIMPTPSSTTRITPTSTVLPVMSSPYLASPSSPVTRPSEPSLTPTGIATESLIPTLTTTTDSLTVSLSSFTSYISTEPPILPSTGTEFLISPTPTSIGPVITATSMVQSMAPSPSAVFSSDTVPVLTSSGIIIPSDTVMPPVTSTIGIISSRPVLSTTLLLPSPSPSADLMTSSYPIPETSVPITFSIAPSASSTNILPTVTSMSMSSAEQVSSSTIGSLALSSSVPPLSSIGVTTTLSPSPTPILPTTSSVVESEIFTPSPTPVHPTSSVLMSSSVIPVITTPEPINQPPMLLNPVDIVTTNFGEFLHQSIPPDTFYDPEEGYTPNLELTLRDKDHAPVTPDSWLQLDTENQVLYGVPLNATVTNYDLEYYLVVSDSEGLTAFDAVVVVIIPSPDIYTHVFSVEIDKPYSDFIADGNNIVELGTRIATFYDDVDDSALYVDSLREGSTIMGYSNMSLDVDVCDLEGINALLNRIAYPNGTARVDFEAYLLPEFPVLFVTKRLQGVCVEPTTTPPTNVTALPITDKNLVVIILVPALIIALLILLLCCLACCWYRRNRAGEEFLLREEKPTYAKNRKPIFLNDELDGLEPNKPSRPIVLPDDISPFRATPTRSTPVGKKKPPPPTYQLPDYAKPSYSNPYFDHHNPDNDQPDYPTLYSPKADILLVDMSLPNTNLPPPRYTPEPEFMQPPQSRTQRSPVPAMYSPPHVEVHRPPPRYTLPPPYDDEEVGFFPTSHV